MSGKYRSALPVFIRDPGGQHWPMTSLSAAHEIEAERDVALAENARLRDACQQIIAQENKAWMPMRAFRSEEQTALDEAKHEAWIDAADIARAALASTSEPHP